MSERTRTRPMASPATLRIEGLRAAVGGTEILRGIDLEVSSGEVHAVMGPNGAGKSTLSAVIMGKPGYEVLSGSVTLDGEDLLALAPWERAAAGLHLVMQYPTEVPGVALDDVMREALTVRGREVEDVDAVLAAEAARIGLEERLLHRALNVDLSGGEKKRNETLQLAVLQPAIAVLDELDSGLDLDALRACARRIEAETQPHDGRPGLGVLAITHYNRLLTELRPDAVHILIKGRIVERGGPELADQLEAEGYAAFADDDAAAAAEAHHQRPGVRPGSLDELFSTPRPVPSPWPIEPAPADAADAAGPADAADAARPADAADAAGPADAADAAGPADAADAAGPADAADAAGPERGF